MAETQLICLPLTITSTRDKQKFAIIERDKSGEVVSRRIAITNDEYLRQQRRG